ncbi:EXPERA domain-containing protein [Aspergillus saccharolyticus JOP 1030-1]|uniref:EBP-domain-containing protein n=1 Tax=Aspergillus saccharolyticus JOP 1030-1 TaxID=1450539 RepID=A0A318ZNQ7_9EURO|nr:EBP-domain-containing protein [Aspergillus saccharolyticus JOP 1030-1]PYH49176.1 EBP-domain-containing protein [Aspergillus saccharolyticus JOP 1030-1]
MSLKDSVESVLTIAQTQLSKIASHIHLDFLGIHPVAHTYSHYVDHQQPPAAVFPTPHAANADNKIVQQALLYDYSAIMAQPFVLDLPTVLCLVMAFLPMLIAYIMGKRLIPGADSAALPRLLFLWHAYDALTHFLIEGSFLYHCFFSSITISAAQSRFGPVFLNNRDRAYGATYGPAWDPTARLWQEYAKADHRWGGADPTVVSIELLTVLLGGPAATYICYNLYLLANGRLGGRQRGVVAGRTWLVAACLATAELYGGFMTFVPEWLAGSPALNTSHWMYTFVYLTFFNGLWVIVPFWVLWRAADEVTRAFVGGTPELIGGAAVSGGSSRKK